MDALSASCLAEISDCPESRAGNGAPGYLFIRLLCTDTAKVPCSGQLPLAKPRPRPPREDILRRAKSGFQRENQKGFPTGYIHNGRRASEPSSDTVDSE